MGKYAEMMLDGTCCSVCGELIGDGDEGMGWAAMCAACEEEQDANPPTERKD